MASVAPSATHRLVTGINGLDALLDGGLPDRRLTLLRGGPGVGKTVLALEILHRNALAGRPGIVFNFEEEPHELIENHARFNWDLGARIDTSIHLMGARVEDEFTDAAGFDISGMLAAIEAKIRRTGARWVLIDGLDALLGALGDTAAALREVFRLKRWLTGCGVAVLLTAKQDGADDDAIPFSTLPYVADCVIELARVLQNQTFRRHLRVIKMRGGRCNSGEEPFVITADGITLAGRENLRLDYTVPDERVTSGIERLDTLLGGGYRRSNSIMVSGAPGTAKTTLASCFAAAMTARGERVLFVSFDEPSAQIVANMRSVGIDFETPQAQGTLRLVGLMAGAGSAESHYIEIRRLMADFEPQHVVIDPVSALSKAGGTYLGADIAERLLDAAKARGITLFLTSLMDGAIRYEESTESHISTVADVWINLTFNIHEGERNRALTIIKARGMNHSKQVRELILSERGLTLADVYIAGGRVLMGTARIQKEQEVAERRAQEGEAFERRRGDLDAEIEQTAQQIATLNRRLTQQQNQLARLDRQAESQLQRRDAYDADLLHRRGAEASDHRFRHGGTAETDSDLETP